MKRASALWGRAGSSPGRTKGIRVAALAAAGSISGTYAHAAPWNEGKFGQVNGSHGCIGMSTADAKWFYDQVHLGDPVTVNRSVDTVAVNNGYGDWNVDWATWQKGSALK